MGPHGGPTVPWTTLNVVDNVPVAVVATSADNEMAVQLTETEALTGGGRATVGCLASELHSRTFPGEPLLKPLPVMVTEAPPLKPVLGVMVTGTVTPAANASIEVPTMARPATKLAAATNASCLDARRRDRRPALTLAASTLTACTDKKSPPRKPTRCLNEDAVSSRRTRPPEFVSCPGYLSSRSGRIPTIDDLTGAGGNGEQCWGLTDRVTPRRRMSHHVSSRVGLARAENCGFNLINNEDSVKS
jgi:hypothetical protein